MQTIGAAYCNHCSSQPLYHLQPCDHKVCYDCSICSTFEPSSSEPLLCERCNQLVHKVVEIKQNSPTIGYFPPTDKTWASPTTKSYGPYHYTISNSSAMDRTDPNKRSHGYGAAGGTEAEAGRPGWGYPVFVPQPPTPGPRFVRPQFGQMPPMSPLTRPDSSASFTSQYDNSHGGVDLSGYRYTPDPTQAHGNYGHANYSIQDSFDGPASRGPTPRPPIVSETKSMTLAEHSRMSADASRNATRTSSRSSSNKTVTGMPPSANPLTKEATALAAFIRSGALEEPTEENDGYKGLMPAHMGPTPQTRGTSRGRGYTGQAGTGQQWLMMPPVPGQGGMGMGLAPSQTPPKKIEIAPDPEWFDKIAQGYKPTLEEAFECLPFTESCRHVRQSDVGVLKIVNIPYTTSKNEILAALGRSARVVSQPVGSPYYAIHIVMDRETGKTLDCFVELASLHEAQHVLKQFQKRQFQGRAPKIGDRHVSVELSSQEELMSEMFSRARLVRWEGANPVILETDEYWGEGIKATGFQGFLTNEEITMLVKHAETPQRSPFANRCHNRTYEMLISTIHKYPWYAVDAVSLGERQQLFNAVKSQIRTLIMNIRRNASPLALTPMLLQELVVAGLANPGFSEQQKASIVWDVQQGGFGNMTTGHGMNARLGGSSRFSIVWPFEVVAQKPEASDELVEFFAKLMREATAGTRQLSLAERAAMGLDSHNPGPFGDIDVDYPGKLDMLSMADGAVVEWNRLEELLKRVLVRSGSPSYA